MITDDLLEQLRYKGEGSDLDFKAERYFFAKATDDEKSELLKDILAFANAFRESTAYVLLGFKEASPQPAEVTGLPAEGVLDDSRLQEFVSGKVDTALEFRYEERMFDGKHIAVLSMPKQPRPFSLKKNYGKLSKDTVYVRRGSATGIATPREIAMMVKADTAQATPDVRLSILDGTNKPLPNSFERTFLQFAEPLPDYEPRASSPYNFSVARYNRDYWRDAAEFHSEQSRFILVRLALSNMSGFSLVNAKLEVTCTPPVGADLEMIRADEAADKPDSSEWAYMGAMKTAFSRANERVTVDKVGPSPTGHVSLGTLRPGETTRAEEDLLILPSGPGSYTLNLRVLADELSNPVVQEHVLNVAGEAVPLDIEGLVQLMFGSQSFEEDE